MYKISDSYERFNQKNTMISRRFWDPAETYQLPERFKTQMRGMEKGIPGFGLKEFALAEASSTLATSLGTGICKPNSGLTSWEPHSIHESYIGFPEEKPAVTDAVAMTSQIKRAARFLGADLVGIANLDLRWVYSHHYAPETGENTPVEIDPRYKYAIVMAIEMDYNMHQTAPSALLLTEVDKVYSKLAFLTSALAEFIRYMGYNAIPMINDTALTIPMAVDAGLGQMGRMGLLLTPQFGPRQRLCKIFTDLPLEIDHPIDFGVTEFCAVCQKCVKECPGQAISSGEPTAEVTSIANNPGVVKWPIAGEKCVGYFARVGTDCSVCIRVCPFNKSDGWFHDVSRRLVKHAPWSHRLLVKMDDLAGYGKYLDPELFWKNKI